MKKEGYTIDRMIELFAEHTVKLKKNREEVLNNLKENYPDQPLPEYIKDDFYISEALLAICKEIKLIKMRL